MTVAQRPMREVTRRNLIHKAVLKAQSSASADIHKLLNRRYKVLKRELRRANFRKTLHRNLVRTGDLFKADDDTWADWIAQFPADMDSALNQIVYGVYDTEGRYWQSRGQQLDPLDAATIIDAYEARTGRQIKDIAEDTKANVLSTITDWYNSDQSLPELIDQLGQYFDENRARMIAETESQFIVSQIALESMQQFGITQFDIDMAFEPGPCPKMICPDQADANPHNVGDEMPPFHPFCKCHVTYIFPDGSKAA